MPSSDSEAGSMGGQQSVSSGASPSRSRRRVRVVRRSPTEPSREDNAASCPEATVASSSLRPQGSSDEDERMQLYAALESGADDDEDDSDWEVDQVEAIVDEEEEDEDDDEDDEDEDDEDEDDAEGDDEDVTVTVEGRGGRGIRMNAANLLRQLLSGRRAQAQRQQEPEPTGPPPPPQVLPPEHALRQVMDAACAAEPLRHPCCPVEEPRVAEGEQPAAGPRSSVMSPSRMLRFREANVSGLGQWSAAQQAHLTAFHAMPSRPSGIADRMQSRAYIGQFSHTGEIFVGAFQNDRRVRLYDVENDWELRKDVHARNLRWTVTDTSISPDQKFLLYCSITPVVNMVDVGNRGDSVLSEANVTDVHESLHFDMLVGQTVDDREQRGMSFSFGIWSLQWSSDGQEIIAGTGDQCLCVFDVERMRTTQRVESHKDDVNAVIFADESSQLVVTGSDDREIKLWDRRALGTRQQPAGVFLGHTEGITHMDSRKDGRYFISNGKDQNVKLWDLRSLRTPREVSALPRVNIGTYNTWDYRWMDYPGRNRNVRHPHDGSVATFQGHSVLQTLIRAYFSPAHTTGQRYIYSGCHSGAVHIWDVASGQTVQRLQYHREIVRDCSWHPYKPLLASCSFDGSICTWENRQTPSDVPEQARGLPAPGHDMYDDMY
ncbi:hypothetical protein WJX74_006159 [Apatococcus lobatus]|uniref:WD repeat-containing protein 23 n=2 Tax=Apatococcus TaxID=904362 RepID=A0AAW1T4W8_9CHLO